MLNYNEILNTNSNEVHFTRNITLVQGTVKLLQYHKAIQKIEVVVIHTGIRCVSCLKLNIGLGN